MVELWAAVPELTGIGAAEIFAAAKAKAQAMNPTPRKPVVSAEKVAAVRAIGALDPLVNNPDDLAGQFLGRTHHLLVWLLTTYSSATACYLVAQAALRMGIKPWEES